MLPPQSGDDVRVVVEALQQLDHLLDIRWEPRAKMVKRGGYTAEGKILNPEYEGRWEIVRDDHHGTAPWREKTRICFVTTPVEIAPGLKAMDADGDYAPLGMWLVEFMRAADKANQEGARRLSERLDQLNAAKDEAAIRDGDAGMAEYLGAMYHAGTKAGGGVSEFHPVKAETAHWGS